MTFIEPAIEEIYDVLSNNDELIKYLKENEYLLTRSMLYDSYTVEQIKEMETAIYANNIETLYNLAKVLLDNSEEIKSHDVWYLTSNLIAFEDIAGSFGLDKNTFSIEAYQLIIYTYKFCYVSSFFQNNKETFFTEYDFNEIENTPILKSFVDALMKEFDKLDCIIGKCIEYHDFDEVPYDLINYLTQLLGFEKANISADDTIEKKYREIVRNIIDVYRVKGTNYSFELLFKFLGYNIEIKEFYFDRRYYYSVDGNINTNTTDNTNSLYYMSIYPPHDNKLNITNNEIVGLFDYTTQYNLDEFSMLADKYGPEAVLGYSKVDKNGNEYEGKIYKYFKSNLVYYTVGLDKENPNEKQLFQINKILSFLTPAYIMKTTNINVYTGSNSNSPSDNMIFFDDNRSINNTLEDLEEGVTTEDGFEVIREKVRDLYPLMLDSEMRDDIPIPKRTNADLYVDEDGNILHDDTSKSPYVNTINTATFKPKVPFIINGKICLNKYAGWRSGKFEKKYLDFITIRNNVKTNEVKEDVTYTDLTIEDYLNNQELKYARSFINTLTLLETAPKTDNNIKNLKIKYNVCLDIEKNFATLPNFIAPITLGKENLIRMIPTKCVLIISGNTVGVYKFGAVPSCNNRYTESFDIKLIKTQILYRSVNKKITINVDLKEEKLNLDALYDAAKAKPNTEALKYYYYNASENSWYYPIRKAKLTSKIISVSGKTKYLMASTVLPISDDMAAEYCIPKIFKVNGKYGYNANTATYDTPEEYFEDNEIEIYNNFSFYIQDEDEPYESDLYTFYVSNNTNPYEISNRLVYSSLDEKLYRISQYNYEELPDFFGRLEINEDTENPSVTLYEYDESWYGYNEVDDKDNFIRYNNEHRIIWTYIDYDKIIGRPIKALTDKEVTPELKELLLNEIYHSTYDYFAPIDKRALLVAGGYSYAIEFFEDIKNGIVKPDVVTFLESKAQDKDVYGNYNDNFKLLYDFLNSGDLDEFVKWYYYDKLTKLYREAIFLDEITELTFNQAEADRKPLFEILNGNMGILGKPNTLLQSRKKTSSINIDYSVIDDSTINVLKNDLIKSGLLIYNNNKPYIQEIRNLNLCYGTKNKLIKDFEINLGNSIISKKIKPYHGDVTRATDEKLYAIEWRSSYVNYGSFESYMNNSYVYMLAPVYVIGTNREYEVFCRSNNKIFSSHWNEINQRYKVLQIRNLSGNLFSTSSYLIVNKNLPLGDYVTYTSGYYSYIEEIEEAYNKAGISNKFIAFVYSSVNRFYIRDAHFGTDPDGYLNSLHMYPYIIDWWYEIPFSSDISFGTPHGNVSNAVTDVMIVRDRRCYISEFYYKDTQLSNGKWYYKDYYFGESGIVKISANSTEIQKSKEVFEFSTNNQASVNNYNITSEEFPEDLRNGYLEVNNTPQLLSDNKINEHTSELLDKEEFVTIGDDRRLDIYEKVEENCKTITSDGEEIILLPSGNYSDVYSVEVEFPDDKKEVFFNRILSHATISIDKLICTPTDLIGFKGVESKYKIGIKKVKIIEK